MPHARNRLRGRGAGAEADALREALHDQEKKLVYREMLRIKVAILVADADQGDAAGLFDQIEKEMKDDGVISSDPA